MQPNDKPIPASFNITPSSRLTEHINAPVNYLIPGLVEAGSTVLFKVMRSAEPGAYPARIAAAIAGGTCLQPFGNGDPHKVLLVHGQGNARADGLELAAILWSGINNDAKSLAERNLQVYHPQNEGGRSLELRIPEVREHLTQLLDEVACVVIADLDGCLTKTSTEKDSPSIGEFFAHLNRSGIAVVAFGTGGLIDRLAPEFASIAITYLSLHADQAAPSGVGGGFKVSRKRSDIHDKVPRQFRYYYQIVGGVFEDHFSMGDVEGATLKKLEILRRRSEVANLLSQGMTQKDIAEQMEVTTATVCRDAEAIHSRQTARSRLTEFAPSFQSGAEG